MLFFQGLYAIQTSTDGTFQSTEFCQTATRFDPVLWSPAMQLYLVFSVALKGCRHQIMMMFRSRKLQSEFSSLCTSCVARNIKSALGLGHHDGFISFHTTIKLVLSSSSENPNTNSTRLSDFGTEGAVTFSSKISPNLVC